MKATIYWRIAPAIWAALVLAFIPVGAQSANDAAQRTDPFFNVPEGRKGLEPGTNLNSRLPNVLILGDSISIGYTKPVTELLKGVANVRRPRANCGDTPMGLQNLEHWLGDTRWDVIHFNWGLWDLCYRHPESKAQGKRDKVRGKQSVALADYEKNLETLVRCLQQTGARLIWATTTLVPEEEVGRFVGDELKYNAAAARVMARHGVATNDLHALTVGFKGKHFVGPGDVHYTQEGYAAIAVQVAAVIRENLPSPKERTSK